MLVGLAIVILAVFAGLKSFAMLAVGLGAAAVGLAAAYFFLCPAGAYGGGCRSRSSVLAPVAVIIVYAFASLLSWRWYRPPRGCSASVAARWRWLAGNRTGGYTERPAGAPVQ